MIWYILILLLVAFIFLIIGYACREKLEEIALKIESALYNFIFNYFTKPGLVFELTMKDNAIYISLPGRKILSVIDKRIDYHQFYRMDYYYKRRILHEKERDEVLLLAAARTKDEKVKEQLKKMLKDK